MMRRRVFLVLVIFSVVLLSAGCSFKKEGETKADLKGKTLFVYCGAGMTKPFSEIVDAFQNETGATIEVTYGNAAQTITQIQTSKEGDLFIAGDQGELANLEEDYVTEVKKLVKHIPVIAVQEGNPKGISGLKDFAKRDVGIVLGDNEATPIGKIADKALSEAGVLDKVNIIARTATAPEISTALTLGQCDAAIVWKENTSVDGLEVVECDDLNNYIKVIPAASLQCSKNTDIREAFLEYLDTDEVLEIWEKYGYETITN